MHLPELLRLAWLLMRVVIVVIVDSEYMERRAARFYSYHELLSNIVE
jgi:hypothetical protein